MNITINDREIEFNSGETVLQVANRAGIRIPHLCSLDWAPSPSASCRLCVVEMEGSPRLQTSCTLQAAEGMKILTHTPRVMKARRSIVELMVANHPQDCLACDRAGSCELADLTQEVGVRPRQYVGMKKDQHLDISSPAIYRDPNKCVLCGRCVTMCHQIQGIGAIDFTDRGLPHPGGAGLLAGPQRLGLHLLRPVRAGLPHRGPHGTQPRGRRGVGAERPEHRGGRPDRPGRARHARPGAAQARGRPRDAGTPGRRAQAHRLQRGVRHRLRRRPHHHGRGHRTGGAGQERGRAPHVHQLLTGLDPVRGAAPARPDPPSLHVQVAAADGRRPHPGDLSQVRRASTTTSGWWWSR